jgi:hypothetical protein
LRRKKPPRQRSKGQEGRQESREKGDAEESQKIQKDFQEILGEEINQKGRQESRQKEEKEGQEVEALIEPLPQLSRKPSDEPGGFCFRT